MLRRYIVFLLMLVQRDMRTDRRRWWRERSKSSGSATRCHGHYKQSAPSHEFPTAWRAIMMMRVRLPAVGTDAAFKDHGDSARPGGNSGPNLPLFPRV